MAGEELDLRADIGAGRIGSSSRGGLGPGCGYPDDRCCKAGGFGGCAGIGGYEEA